MAIQSSANLVSFSPLNREQRARRRQLSVMLVIFSIAGSALLLHVFHDGHRAHSVPAPAAFAYFPN